MPKILVIRLSSIGDIVLTTPVLRCLKTQVNGAELHLLVKKDYLPVVEHNPYLDKIHLLQYSLNDILSTLKQENFDYVIDLHHNLRSLIIKQYLRKKSFSFNKINFEKWLMVNFKINHLPAVHIVDRYFETVKTLNVFNDQRGLDYFLPDSLMNQFESRYETGIFNQLFYTPYIAFVIGANHATKRLPVNKIISICKKLNRKIVLLGGKGDNDRAIDIVAAAGPLVLNACGKFTLSESALVIKQAEQVITHDTGLMHIAAAFGKPIISVWGNTIPEFGMTPYYGNNNQKAVVIETKNLKCRPCSKIGFSKCPKQHFNCMNRINESQIVEAIKTYKNH